MYCLDFHSGCACVNVFGRVYVCVVHDEISPTCAPVCACLCACVCVCGRGGEVLFLTRFHYHHEDPKILGSDFEALLLTLAHKVGIFPVGAHPSPSPSPPNRVITA